MTHEETRTFEMLSFDAGEVRSFVGRLFEKAGWSAEHARTAADQLVASDLAGHPSHGIGLLPTYVRTIAAGRLTPSAAASVRVDNGSFLVVDGNLSLGQVSALNLTRRAIEMAHAHGIALANLINSHHVGRIGYFGETVARAGYIGLFWVNVHGRQPTVVPYGGREPRFSTNPHCIAIPCEGKPPFLLDFATAEIAVNKARVAAAQGKRMRHGTLIDARGRPSDDPGVLFREPRGSIAAFGLHKGSGLAIACELLSSILSGGPMVADREEQGAILNNMLALVIDPARMASDGETVAAATARMLDWVRSAAPAEGVMTVLTPGEPEAASRARFADRLEIDAATWDAIAAAALSVGLEQADVPGRRGRSQAPVPE
ncbi:MAG: malate/lactate/ureidoglycolate dehydrogenase [Hyphomicrobiaceae bacterium]